jgi:predicted SAM-dependent methyltransferase
MPRRFDTVEVLHHEPPFSATVLEELGLPGIHCGSARQLRPGWLNTDRLHLRGLQDGNEVQRGRIARVEGHVYYLEHDSREPYPCADASFQWAYSEHFIEHLSPDEVTRWLVEVRRILKPGGHLRLSTPDLQKYMTGYVDSGDGFFAEHRERLGGLRAFADKEVPDRRAWMVNQIFYRWDHRWIFDFDEIRYVAECAGFDRAAVTRRSFNEGAVADVAAMDMPFRSDESLYVELSVA